ncbi:MAG: GTPase ObgE, partial [Candidatus Caldatribacteriota bacterium]|nr:GTPase ObgE [Candidatus Caldatribacteriota bacterium]
LVIKVPPGTMIEDADSSEILADLVNEKQRVKIALGGEGGKGNYRFKNSVRRVPRFAQKGEPGEIKKLYLTLKLIADIGLVGYPNVGKSTLLSRISSAKPKIADYPFTTLNPGLGVVRVDENKSFIVADIPGLIEGAHQGVGLGDKFLKHIERTEIILHLIDGSKVKKNRPLDDIKTINNELNRFSEELVKKPQVLAINKCDLLSSRKEMENLKEIFQKEGCDKIYFVSALKGEGLKELIYGLSSFIDSIKKEKKSEVSEIIPRKEVVYKFTPRFVITKNDDVYVVSGKEIEKIAAMTNFDNEEAIEYFQKIIRDIGLEKALISKGIRDGEMVKIKEKSFYFFS